MPGIRLLPCGERGVLVEVADSEHALALADALAGTPQVSEVVPGACTVLVLAADAAVLGEVRAAVRAAAASPPPARPAAGHVEVPVRYDGADLAAVAAECGLSEQAVVARHTAARYTVAFCGFAPGFAYLTGLDPALRVGRLLEPRTSVPGGAVGIADEFTAAYPRPSPGGWRLLGRTDAVLWDPARGSPSLLAPGMTVRFVPA